MENSLKKLIDEDQEDWDMKLKGLLFAYRTSVHATTKQTPYYIMYGRKPTLPLDLDELTEECEQMESVEENGVASAVENSRLASLERMEGREQMESVEENGVASAVENSRLASLERMEGREQMESVEENGVASHSTSRIVSDITKTVVDRHRLACERVQNNIMKAQEKQKRLYDKKHCSGSNKMCVGTLVLLKNNRNKHRMGGKLDDKWSGPYEITESLNKGCFKLKNVSSGVTLKKAFNGANLKLYKCETTNEESDKLAANVEEVADDNHGRKLSKDQRQLLSCLVEDEIVLQLHQSSSRLIEEEHVECMPAKVPAITLQLAERELHNVKHLFHPDALLVVDDILKRKVNNVPGSWMCTVCKTTIQEGAITVSCDMCMEWNHVHCAKFHPLNRGWACDACFCA